jgi:hypothetical protein
MILIYVLMVPVLLCVKAWLHGAHDGIHGWSHGHSAGADRGGGRQQLGGQGWLHGAHVGIHLGSHRHSAGADRVRGRRQPAGRGERLCLFKQVFVLCANKMWALLVFVQVELTSCYFWSVALTAVLVTSSALFSDIYPAPAPTVKVIRSACCVICYRTVGRRSCGHPIMVTRPQCRRLSGRGRISTCETRYVPAHFSFTYFILRSNFVQMCMYHCSNHYQFMFCALL